MFTFKLPRGQPSLFYRSFYKSLSPLPPTSSERSAVKFSGKFAHFRMWLSFFWQVQQGSDAGLIVNAKTLKNRIDYSDFTREAWLVKFCCSTLAEKIKEYP